MAKPIIASRIHPLMLIAAGRVDEAKAVLDLEVAVAGLIRVTPFSLTDVVAEEVARRVQLFASVGDAAVAELNAVRSVTADICSGRIAR